jgi:hypothetical protein
MPEIVKLGERRPTPGSKPPPAPAREDDRSRILVITGCAIAVMAVLFGGVYLMTRGTASPQGAAAPTSTQAAGVAPGVTGGGRAAVAPSFGTAPGVTGAGGSQIAPAFGGSSGVPGAGRSGIAPAVEMAPAHGSAPAPGMAPGVTGAQGAAPAAAGTRSGPTDDNPYAGGPHDR